MSAAINDTVMVVAALPFVLVVAQVGGVAYKRLRGYAVARCVAKISAMIMAEEEPSDRAMRALLSHYSVGVVFDSALFVSERIYGDALNRLVLVAEVCGLHSHLLGSIGRSRGMQRVRHLAKIPLLANGSMVAEYAEVYMDETCNETRFFAMMALISSRHDRTIRYITRYDAPLTLYQVALLTNVMRRAGVAMAYTPLLTSTNRNLQMIGIYLTHHFSIVDAEPHLQRLAESGDRDVSYMALLTICAIRGDISTPEVCEALQQLTLHQRNTFILRAVQNCYSLRSCAHHLSREECLTFAHRLKSYKCQLVCN